jgi:O-antigen/teichoic acid export membrane protein
LLGQAGYAVIVKLFAEGRWREGDHATRRSVWMVSAVSMVIAVSMALFAEQILKVVGGKEFVAGAVLLQLVLIGRALAAGAPSYSSSLTALGRPGASATANLVSNIAMLPLLPPLLWWLGDDGAGWHVIAQSLALTSFLAIAYHRCIRNRESAAL